MLEIMKVKVFYQQLSEGTISSSTFLTRLSCHEELQLIISTVSFKNKVHLVTIVICYCSAFSFLE